MIAIIPARGGSKRLPRKNVLSFNGMPLICHSIKQAYESKCFDKIYVSTDDEEIINVSLLYGAEINNNKHELFNVIIRPSELAQDNITTRETIKHAIQITTESDSSFNSFMVLQPTSPLRNIDDIIFCANLIGDYNNVESVVSVCNTKPGIYEHNGAIYGCTVDFFERYGLWGKDTFLYQMPREKSIDIDEQWQFDIAEFLMKKNNQIRN